MGNRSDKQMRVALKSREAKRIAVSRKSIAKSGASAADKRAMLALAKTGYTWIHGMEKAMYRKIGTLSCEVWTTAEPVAFSDFKTGAHRTLCVGDVWANNVFDCGWFHFTGELPNVPNPVCLIDISGEGLIYDNTGRAFKGITTFASEFAGCEFLLPVKKVVPLENGLLKDGKIDFYMDGAANDLFGNFCNSGKIMQLDIAETRTEIRTVKYDAEVLFDLFLSLDETETAYRIELASALTKAKALCEHGEYQKAHAVLQIYLDKKSESDFSITAHGHAHLDLAWLWPIRETKRKGLRTFATQLGYIENYPDYVFGASQAQLFEWIKENDAELYARIKQQVAAGKIQIQGAPWVESDCNLPSGESLVRQMLYGKQFWKAEFGIDSDVMWIPDTFGYSGSLPQILKKSGIPYFITQKLSWNTVNTFPYQSFRWSGTDGSEILAHLLPANTYNGKLDSDEILRAQRTYKERAVSSCAMMAYGVGDGGGGPSLDHVERLTRERDLRGLPHINTLSTHDFMENLGKSEKLPAYQGELYLERHRGTYTTQAKNKKYNRKMEQTLRDAELLCCAAHKLCGAAYPAEAFKRLWKEALLYQFHDILPGSSIARVYEETAPRYEAMLKEAAALAQNAANTISEKVGAKLYFNTLPWERDGVPALGFASEKSEAPKSTASGNTLENEFLRVTFNKDGAVGSAVDKKSGRELVRKNEPWNEWILYCDFGDCWDIRPAGGYMRLPKKRAKCTSVSEDGNAIKLHFTVGHSEITQAARLSGETILFDTEVRWQEKNRMLRVEFPVSAENRMAAYQIQYGHIYRPTTHDDSVSKAMFEASAHKWCDLSDENGGLSLLNDCKYGYRIWNHTISMNVLRAPNFPGKGADLGTHHLRYALYPHSGTVESSRTYEYAWHLNTELLYAERAEGKDQKNALLRCDNPKIMADTLKRSEDENGYILRLYNMSEQKQNCRLQSDFFDFVSETDFMETDIADMPSELEFAPFEARAFRLK